MARDPFTLHVALSPAGAAAGELYLDDGDTDKHASGPLRACACAQTCL